MWVDDSGFRKNVKFLADGGCLPDEYIWLEVPDFSQETSLQVAGDGKTFFTWIWVTFSAIRRQTSDISEPAMFSMVMMVC